MRNPQHPPSSPLLYPKFPKDHHGCHPVLHVSGQEPSTSSKYVLPSLTPPLIPDTLLIKISIQNVQGIFLRVNKCHPWHLGLACPPSLRSGTLNILQGLPKCSFSFVTLEQEIKGWAITGNLVLEFVIFIQIHIINLNPYRLIISSDQLIIFIGQKRPQICVTIVTKMWQTAKVP